MKTVTFICTGNTCRSPMAAALFAQHLQKKNITDILVQSAGLAATGAPAEPNAVTAMAEMGIDISGHTSKQLTAEHLRQGGYFVCMTQGHKTVLLQAGVPERQIFVLGIPDPYGGDLQVYRACRDALIKLLPELVNALC